MTEKFAGNGFCIHNYLRVTEHNKSVVQDCRESEERIFKAKRSHFIGFFIVEKCMSDMVHAFSAVGVCAQGWAVTQATPFHLFVVISDIMFEQTLVREFLSCAWEVTRMSASSPIGHVRHPLLRVAVICCLTSTRWDTYFGNMFDWKISREMKSSRFLNSKLYACYKTQHVCCAWL